MILTCPQCQAQLQINEAALRTRPVAVKCPRCQALVNLPAPPSAGAAPASQNMPGEAAADGIPPPPSATSAARWQRRQALVCLQDPAARQRAGALLDAHGFTAHVAEAAASATTIFQEERISFVFLDPQFDPQGQGAAHVLRSISGLPPRKRRQVYLVLVSPAVRTHDRQAAFLTAVNLTVNSADLDMLPQTLERSLRDFNELYQPLNQALGTPPI